MININILTVESKDNQITLNVAHPIQDELILLIKAIITTPTTIRVAMFKGRIGTSGEVVSSDNAIDTIEDTITFQRNLLDAPNGEWIRKFAVLRDFVAEWVGDIGSNKAKKYAKDLILALKQIIINEVSADRLKIPQKRQEVSVDLDEALNAVFEETGKKKLHPIIDVLPNPGLVYGIPHKIEIEGSSKAIYGNLWISKEGVFIYPSEEFEVEPSTFGIVVNDRYKENIKRLIKEMAKDELYVPTNEEIARELIDILKYYIYIRPKDEIDYYIYASWVAMTYVWPIMPTLPILVIVGQRNSGKTTLLKLLTRLCFHTPDRQFVTPSPASFYRIVNGARATWLTDEGHLGENVYLRAIYEAGFDQKSAVPRVIENSGGRVEFLDVFGPKALVTRETPQFVSKALWLRLERAPKKKRPIYSKRRLELSKKELPKVDELNYRLMVWTLYHFEEVKEALESTEPDEEFSGRVFDKWLPIIVIAKVLFPDKVEEIKKRALEIYKQEEDLELMGKIEDAVISAVFELMVQEVVKQDNVSRKDAVDELLNVYTDFTLTVRDITDMVRRILEDSKIKEQQVGSAIKNLGLSIEKKKLAGRVAHKIDVKRLFEVAEDRGIELVAEDEDEENQYDEGDDSGDMDLSVDPTEY